MTKKPLGVLILHGYSANINCVSPLEAPIQALGLPTRMPVLRGHGSRPEDLEGVTWRDWVADGRAALEDLLTEVEKAVIVGHSMGGLVAINLAADFAEGTDSIVLAAAGIQPASPLAPGKPLAFLLPVARLLMKRVQMGPNYVDKAQDASHKNYMWVPISSTESFLEFTQQARRRLPEVKAPALILHSKKDATIEPASAEIIYQQISTPAAEKRIQWFEVSGHEMFRDIEREAVVKAVVEYVRGRMERKNLPPAPP